MYQTIRRYCRVNVRCGAQSSSGRSFENGSAFIFRVRQSLRKVPIAPTLALYRAAVASSERSEVLQGVECVALGSVARSLGTSSVFL
jgi:hypothetical protein